ncbi:hypothetical protein Tco_1132289 [Tanacetum coccineum]|uniref:Tf2-1-like SH3-like domain-containing protein n=1 Tax=Tanacetum coccineum TaxID=301880 RepID=A0ABQ5JBK9_9ASTR
MIGPVAYRLRLPEELSGVHDTFHVSTLKKCLADASLHVPLDEIKVDKTIRFVEEPVEIMDCEIKSVCEAFVGFFWEAKHQVSFMRILRLREVARMTARIALEFAPEFVYNDHDVIHDNNSSDLALSASLNDLDLAPPNIILVDEDDHFIDDEDDVPHDLADFDDEVLANANDDDEATTIVYSSDEED